MLNDTLSYQPAIEKVDERYILYFQGNSLISDHDVRLKKCGILEDTNFNSQMKSQNIAIAYGMLSYAADTRNSTKSIHALSKSYSKGQCAQNRKKTDV